MKSQTEEDILIEFEYTFVKVSNFFCLERVYIYSYIPTNGIFINA